MGDITQNDKLFATVLVSALAPTSAKAQKQRSHGSPRANLNIAKFLVPSSELNSGPQPRLQLTSVTRSIEHGPPTSHRPSGSRCHLRPNPPCKTEPPRPHTYLSAIQGGRTIHHTCSYCICCCSGLMLSRNLARRNLQHNSGANGDIAIH